MKLEELLSDFDTDKGSGHNYIEYYNSILTPFEFIESNIMEIGILRGESIRLWHKTLPKANIFALDNFSHSTLDPSSILHVKEKVTSLPRVTLIEPVDSRSPEEVNSNLKQLGKKFDVIIDDGDHSVEAQLRTFTNFFPYLSKGGVYVIEDVIGMASANKLAVEIRRKYPESKICIHVFNFLDRHDDIIVEVKL